MSIEVVNVGINKQANFLERTSSVILSVHISTRRLEKVATNTECFVIFTYFGLLGFG